jgi:hypothetical protein
MLKKNIKYTDYNGVERNEDFYFNLTKAEIMEMQMGTTGGLADMIAKIVATQDTPKIVEIFKNIIKKAYGEKSADGKRFMKKDENGVPLVNSFEDTEAFSELFMELATDDKAAAAFINGIIPADMHVSEEKQQELMNEMLGVTPETKPEQVEAEVVTKSE